MPVLNLPADQLEALEAWAGRNGRNWKSALRFAWETGNYDGVGYAPALQRVLNIKGPSWLIRFRLPNVNCAKCGKVHIRAFSCIDHGEGPEAGRTFYYCSAICRETH